MGMHSYLGFALLCLFLMHCSHKYQAKFEEFLTKECHAHEIGNKQQATTLSSSAAALAAIARCRVEASWRFHSSVL